MIGFSKRLMAVGALAAAFSGQAMAMSNMHPYFSVKHILPAAMDGIPGIGGLGLLPNGDGVICTWGGSQKSDGEVWIVPALATGTPGTPTKIATGLREALGVAVVGQDFYVLEKPRILKFTGSGTTWTKSTLWTLPTAWYNDAQWHHFSFNLEYKEDGLWFTTGMAYDPNPNDPLQRGALIKVALNGSGFQQFARGMRNTNGMGIGPDSGFFITDNQGHWKPVNVMYAVPTKNIPTNGRFYGYRTTTNNACGTNTTATNGVICPNDPEYPPAIWLPYGGFSNSPTRPMMLKAGPYAGQMISGDVYKGVVLRYFLEKVKGEWQGAAFQMMTNGSSGINFGINQFLYTPSGSILVAGIGGGTCNLGGSGNWAWNGTCRGLDLLTPTTSSAFEMLAIRSLADGFDVEFTQPVNAALAGDAANWTVRTTGFTPVFEYGVDGNSADNNINVAVSSAMVSADGKHVRLKLASLSTGRMYAITPKSTITSATGAALYSPTGFYTLNNVSTDTSVVAVAAPAADLARRIHGGLHRGRIALDLPFEGGWKLEILRLDGTRAAQASGTGPSRFETGSLAPGLYVVAARAGNGYFSEKIRVQ